MKTLAVLCPVLLIAVSATAQVQFGLKVGITPTRVMGTAPLLVNRSSPTSEFLFKGNKAEYSPTLGLAVKLNTNQFFFEGEAMYYTIRKSYAMEYIHSTIQRESPSRMDESCKAIDLPLSAGVKLGRIEIKSGLSVRYEFGQSSSLASMPGFHREIADTVFGWHGGIGLSLGRLSAELRYHQEFGNYGKGIYVNDQELLLKNSPTQLRVVVGVWF